MQEEWSWEKDGILRGTGIVVKKGFLLKRMYVEELRFRIKGRLSAKSKGTEAAKDILYFKLGVEDIGVRHLPVSFVEIITNALWEINIDTMQKVNVNKEALRTKDLLMSLAKSINEGERVRNLHLRVLGSGQSVDVNLDFGKKDIKGDIKFKTPVSKRDLDRFCRDLQELLKLFHKKERKGRGRRKKDKGDGKPLEYGGPGQEPVKWYAVHGRG